MAGFLPFGEQQFFSNAGAPLALGTVTFYIPGTTTPKDTWQDSAASILNTNPVALDIAGRAIIYGSDSYRQIVKDAAGNTIWDEVVAAPLSNADITAIASAGFSKIDLFTNISAHTFASTINSLTTGGYSTTGLGGGTYVADSLANAGLAASCPRFCAADASGRYWRLLPGDRGVSPLQGGAIGDNSTDDGSAFQATITYCQALLAPLFIPRKNYALASQLVVTIPIDINSDGSATMRWTNGGSCGWLFDLRAAGSNFGLNTVNLPQLYSPACSSVFAYQSYPSAWTPAARIGNGVTMWGGSRMDINVKSMLGWAKGGNIAATYDVTNGARAPENINFTVNTMDIMTYGFYIDGGPTGAAELTAINCVANTVFAQFPVYLNSSVNPIFAVNVTVSGQVFINEAGGAVVYEFGSQTNSCRFDFAWIYAGYSSYDSPTGTSTTLELPYLAGAQSSHSLTTDGNATVGYFGGYGNSFSFGMAMQMVGQPGAALPASGGVVRVRDGGSFNRVNVSYYDQNQPAIALSTTIGEGNFNGGVGGAAIGKRIYCSIVVPTLANLSTATFYFYHSWLSSAGQRPVNPLYNDSTLQNSGLKVEVIDQSGTANRQGAIIVSNVSGASITGATYFLWVEVMN